MYAVFRSGGKQYRAAKGDVLRVEKLDIDEGATVSFDEVLLIGEGKNVKVGSPVLEGSSVSGKVLKQGRSRKVPVVKFKRRANYLRQGSHRQHFTEVEITGISGAGSKAASRDAEADAAVTKKTAAKKKVAVKKPAAKKAASKKPAAKKSATKNASRKKAAKSDDKS